jgi:hypothetical protein
MKKGSADKYVSGPFFVPPLAPKKVQLFPRFAFDYSPVTTKNGVKSGFFRFARSFAPLADVNRDYFIFFACRTLAQARCSAQKQSSARKRIAPAD